LGSVGVFRSIINNEEIQHGDIDDMQKFISNNLKIDGEIIFSTTPFDI
jgi:hypothetical protein